MNLRDIRNYIRYRWFRKTHQLTSNLKKGDWHELEKRMLHCLFDELVNYVEIEACPQAIEEWLHRFGKRKHNKRQAEAYREILRLYRWWKKIRPARKNASDTANPQKYQETIVKYDDEDTEMLIRLIKIRHFLWT